MNNFAISSGGIGEALKRSASALAAGNNDLSESIALITTANTVAQDAVTVGQGLKTASLRIRSTKTELEEMGEDAEGAAENVSKLREQMLALTGVDIQIDDTTYKSTYQILLEISKVWGRLDDLSRSSVLEQLFGKRQANIGAAILENGELLERVYKTAENSAGSAMREQEEYAKSIQYSIDTLKAAYQDFADSVVNSDAVKSILGIAQKFLEHLTAIVDKLGAVPTLLLTIGKVSAFKGGNMIGGLAGLLTGKNQGLTIDDNDVRQLRQYNALIKQGTSMEEAQAIALKDVSDNARKLATSANGAAVSEKTLENATKSLTASEKAAEVATKGLNVALNMLGNLALMAAVSLIVKGVSELADWLILSKDEMNEISESAVDGLTSLNQSFDELNEKRSDVRELLVEYNSLIKSTDDTSEKKEGLIQIQDALIEKFGEEAKSLDLLNDSYDENIKKIEEMSAVEYEDWKLKNASDIENAKRISEFDIEPISNTLITSGTFASSIFAKEYDDIAASLYVIKNVSDDVRDAFEDIEGVRGVGHGLGKEDIFLSGDIHEATEQVKAIIEEYRSFRNYDEATLKSLTDQYNKLSEAAKMSDEWLEKAATHADELANAGNNAPLADTWIAKLRDRLGIEDEFTPFFKGINENIGAITTDNLNKLKSEIGATKDEVEKNLTELRDNWFSKLEESNKETLSTIDDMKSALQTIIDGELLSSDDFWALKEIDTSNILTDVEMVGNQFKLNEEQIIQLKDNYINSQVKSLNLENEKLKTQIEETNNLIEQAKIESALLASRGLSNAQYRKEYNDSLTLINNGQKKVSELEQQWERNRLRIKQYNAELGNTADYTDKITQKVKEMQEYADAYAKAFTNKIDGIINDLQKEADALNDQKSAMQEQLEVLENQKAELEGILDDYKEIASIIENEVNKEIDAIKEQQKTFEDSYNARIDALKAENEEREDSLEYAQKLANLENAKNNKVRVIDATRGFRYESVKEDVVQAENDLKSFENEQEIKRLEKERDEGSKDFEAQIEDYEDYLKQFKDIQEEETRAENERLMQEIFGSDWREKIKKKDTDILTTYQTNFRSYTSQLSILTKNEIESLKKSIKAKEEEIAVKQKQIASWRTYKSDVETAIDTVNKKYEDYMGKLNEVNLAEDTRETSLSEFVTTYEGYVSQIQGLQSQLSDKTVGLYIDSNLHQISSDLADFILNYGEAVSAMATAMENADVGMGLINSDWDYKLVKAANALKAIKGSDASGGVNSETGLYMLHGEKQRSEITFNAEQARSLFNMVKSNNFANLVADKALHGIVKAGDIKSNQNTSSVSIGAINVYANNPQELSVGLDKQLDKYFRNKLTQSYTK